MTAMPDPRPEPSQQPRQEDALETGAVQQDAEGRRTSDPGKAVEHADSEAERNAEHLDRGEVGPGVPPEDED
jgi:hypothetical protein